MIVAIAPMSIAHMKFVYTIEGLKCREGPTRPCPHTPKGLIVSFSFGGTFPIDEGHTDDTGIIKHPISWAGETVQLQDVEHPLFHHDLAEDRRTGNDVWGEILR